jgi:hypothetical protein
LRTFGSGIWDKRDAGKFIPNAGQANRARKYENPGVHATTSIQTGSARQDVGEGISLRLGKMVFARSNEKKATD